MVLSAFFKKNSFLLLLTVLSLNIHANDIHDDISVKWYLEEDEIGKNNPVSTMVLSNSSFKDISCNGWSLWFNFMRGINTGSVDNKFKIEHKNGDLYQLSFIDKNLVIPRNSSLAISFKTNGVLPNFTDAPFGFYLTYDSAIQKAYPIKSAMKPVLLSTDETLNKLSDQFDENQLKVPNKAQMVIPSPLAIQPGEGFYTINANSAVLANPLFKKEENYLKNFLKQNTGITLADIAKDNSAIKILHNNALETEAYSLVVSKSGIVIEASTPAGAFYAIQTLLSLTPADSWGKSSKAIKLSSITIKDKPRFGYRGLMLDVARNFQTKESVKLVIDVMALYKMNKLHLHLNDDEGWRIEIPKLPELTEVGSIRNGKYPEGKSLQPAYGSGTEGKPKQFYTVNDFKEILIYADERHIQVIPELETPGHARAAIKSMEFRYQKYMSLGDTAEATKYLLHDKDDQSKYSSAQRWSDNVMNVAMPSVYSFIATVLDELKAVYDSAGIPLHKVSLGGDEVPKGVWEKSPKIQHLRDSLDLTSVHQVWPYYIQKITSLCKTKGLELAGWEEMGMVNNGNGMQKNPALADTGIQLDVWNNLVGDGQEDLAYKLANAGYKVVFTSASNLYFDLAWKNDFNEPGHNWAGFTDIKKSYSFLPENYFLNIFNDNAGNKLADGYFDNKERLTTTGINNLIGIKGAVWTEKIPNQDRLEYMLFPRVIALAERAWGPKPLWETGKTFDQQAFSESYRSFMEKLGTQELQKMDRLNGGYSYRLPAIGVKLREEFILCNVEYPGFSVFYTTDGSEPNLKSNKYTQPILLNRKNTYKFSVITSQGRAGETVTLNLKN